METIKNLVSIVTPCYNGEQHIKRLLNSILDQSYPFVEHFVIDDGSIDKTKEIIQSYIPLYNQKGYKLEYHYQKNSGQSVAINKGLKLIKGEFFIWPDADDYYAASTAIEDLVNTLKYSNEDVSIVRALLKYIDENTLTEIRRIDNSLNFNSDLFEDCLFGKNGFWYCSGNYLCKTQILFNVIPDKKIYTEKNAGQNWQLMLPLLYKYKCITIKKYLYNVLERSSSHSRGQYTTLEQVLVKYGSYENTLLNTLKRMNMFPIEEKENYIQRIRNEYQLKRINLYFDYGNFKVGRMMYHSMGLNDKKIDIRYYLSFIPMGKYLYKVLIKLRLI